MSKLTQATVDIKCHRDGKQADTVSNIYIKGANKVTYASGSLSGVGIGDNEEKPVALSCASASFSADDAVKGIFEMTFEPNGNDTMHFDLDVSLKFDDGTSLDYNWQEQTLSENVGNKLLVLKLDNPN